MCELKRPLFLLVLVACSTNEPSASAFFNGPAASLADAADPGGGSPHVPASTTRSILVVFRDPNFQIVRDIDVSVSLTHPRLDELRVALITPDSTVIELLLNRTDPTGTSNVMVGASGADLVGTVFDQEAAQSIRGNTGGAASTGHFRPELGDLSVYDNISAAQVVGTWSLEITDYRNGNTGALTAWQLLFKGTR